MLVIEMKLAIYLFIFLKESIWKFWKVQPALELLISDSILTSFPIFLGFIQTLDVLHH